MIIPTLTSADLLPVLPAAILAVGGITLMVSEAFLKHSSRAYQPILAAIACAFAGGSSLTSGIKLTASEGSTRLLGFAVFDAFTCFGTATVTFAAVLVLLLSTPFLREREAERGEYYALVLFAVAGMSLLMASAEFISLFINLELMSISTYALAAYLRRGLRPAEAAFKYFILGAFASALLLYGAALIYGATGSTQFEAIARALPAAVAQSPNLLYTGFALVLVGFAFKVSAVPFHMWTPDVYEGAPSPVTALMSAGVKAAAFIALLRTLVFLTPGIPSYLPYLVLCTLALLTMVGGNLLALPQRNVKRMLAYSSIAHAGYLLLGLAARFAPATQNSGGVFGTTGFFRTGQGVSDAVDRGILVYLIGYAFTAIGAFGVLGAIERKEDETKSNTWDLDRLAGLSERHPGWAACMAIFMLSLGGVPTTIGFIGKVLLFGAAVNAGQITLALVGILTSVLGMYYYLRVVVYMYMRPSRLGDSGPKGDVGTHIALAVAALAVMGLGIFPDAILGWFSRAGMLFGG